MSALRQQARKVKAEDALRRRNWNPDPASGHYKVYKWWQRKSHKHIGAENFCHYWRVVFIWAPLRWLLMPFLVLLAACAAAGLVTLLVIKLEILLAFGIIVVGSAYVLFGVRTTGQMAKELNENELGEFEWPWLDERSNTIKAACCFLAAPVELVLGIIVLVFGSAVAFFGCLHEDYDVYRRCGRWFVGAHFSEHKALSWIRPWVALPVSVAVLSIWYVAARAVLIWMGCVAVIAVLVAGVAFFADRQQAKQAEARRQARLAEEQAQREREQARRARERQVTILLVHRLFEILHPEWGGDEERFNAWFNRYDQYCLNHWGMEAYDLGVLYHFRYSSKRYLEKYGHSVEYELYDEPELQTVEEVKEPSKLRVALTNAGDFFALLWSVLVAQKHKICPLVQLPE